MKVKVNEKKPVFKPVKLEIELETRNELFDFWMLVKNGQFTTNFSKLYNTLEKVYQEYLNQFDEWNKEVLK